MKTYNTIAVETDINGVDSNEELAALFARALELCEKSPPTQASAMPSPQYLSFENVTYCITNADSVDLQPVPMMEDGNDSLENIPSAFPNINHDDHNDGNNNDNNDEDDKDDDDNDDDKDDDNSDADTCSSHGQQSTSSKIAKEKFQCSVCDKVYIRKGNFNKHVKSHQQEANTDKGDDTEKQNNDDDDNDDDDNDDDDNDDDDNDDDDSDDDNSDAGSSDEQQSASSKIAKEKFQCSVCDKVYTSKVPFDKHVKSHQQEANTDKGDGTGNDTEKHTKEKMVCPHCDKAYSRQRPFKKHLAKHSTEDDVTRKRPRDVEQEPMEQLDENNEMEENITESQQNVGTAEQEPDKQSKKKESKKKEPPTYPCAYCVEVFTNKRLYKKHVKGHAVASIARHICPYCKRVCQSPTELKCHIRIHTKEKPYQCQLCDKAFTLTQSLLVHTRRHTGDKPYKCSFCDKAFVKKWALDEHTRRHTGEKPYKCEHCDKAFRFKNVLKSHMSLHTGIKPYTCQLCSKGFVKNALLEQHIRSHTGERPFKCSYCDRAFQNKANWRLHEKKHLAEAVEFLQETANQSTINTADLDLTLGQLEIPATSTCDNLT